MDDVGSTPIGGTGHPRRPRRRRGGATPSAYYWHQLRHTEQRRGLFHGVPEPEINAPWDWAEQDVLPRARRRPTSEWEDPTADEALRSLGFSPQVPADYYEAVAAHPRGCRACEEGQYQMPFNMLVVVKTDRWKRLENDHLVQLLKRIRTEMQK